MCRCRSGNAGERRRAFGPPTAQYRHRERAHDKTPERPPSLACQPLRTTDRRSPRAGEPVAASVGGPFRRPPPPLRFPAIVMCSGETDLANLAIAKVAYALNETTSGMQVELTSGDQATGSSTRIGAYNQTVSTW